MLADYTICTFIQITLPVLGVEKCFDHHFVGNFVCYQLIIIADVALFILIAAFEARR